MGPSDDVVGADGEEEQIERGMVELAQRDAVADDRLALGVAVWRAGCAASRSSWWRSRQSAQPSAYARMTRSRTRPVRYARRGSAAPSPMAPTRASSR